MRDNNLVNDSHLNFIYSLWTGLPEYSWNFFQFIVCPPKFSCSSKATQQQKKIYFTTSTGSRQDVAAKLKENKSDFWGVTAGCAHDCTHTRSNINPEACKTHWSKVIWRFSHTYHQWSKREKRCLAFCLYFDCDCRDMNINEEGKIHLSLFIYVHISTMQHRDAEKYVVNPFTANSLSGQF